MLERHFHLKQVTDSALQVIRVNRKLQEQWFKNGQTIKNAGKMIVEQIQSGNNVWVQNDATKQTLLLKPYYGKRSDETFGIIGLRARTMHTNDDRGITLDDVVNPKIVVKESAKKDVKVEIFDEDNDPCVVFDAKEKQGRMAIGSLTYTSFRRPEIIEAVDERGRKQLSINKNRVVKVTRAHNTMLFVKQ